VTRLPKQNTTDIYPTPGQTTALGGSSFQFNFNYQNFGIQTGDYITVRHLYILGLRGQVNTSQQFSMREFRNVCYLSASARHHHAGQHLKRQAALDLSKKLCCKTSDA